MRVSVIGCGVIGRQHARSIAQLAPLARLTLAVDVVPERAAELAAEYGSAHALSPEDAFTSSEVDAVAICTPSGAHAELTVAALEAGKHVIVEKPLDTNLTAARTVADAVRRTGRKVTVVSQHRFDAASQVVHQAVQDGRFGRITSGVASVAWWRTQDYYDSGQWRGTWALDGGGALMNQSIHTVDLLVWMLGKPVEVFAMTGLLAHERIEVEDTAAATIRFENGALGLVHATTAAYPGVSARLQVHGDRGSAVIDNDRLVFLHTFAEGGTAFDSDVRSVNQTAGADPAALSNAHTAQYRDFLDAVAHDRPPLVGVSEATTALAVVCGIYESARLGQPVCLDHVS